MDVEGAEIAAIPEWIESGVLDSVDQIGIEMHTAVKDVGIIRDLIGNFQGCSFYHICF